MFSSYLKTAFRHFTRHKATALINLIGLMIGLSSCLMISLYIRHELQFDGFEKNADRVARVIMTYQFDGGGPSNAGDFTSVRVASVFKRQFPEVENAVKMVRYERVISYSDKLINEKNVVFADSSFFSVFTFPLIAGQPQHALSAPHQVVLTQSASKRYFGTEDPMGKSIRIGADSVPYQVSGLAVDCPTNSQIRFDFLVSFSSLGLGKEYEESYWDANYTTYMLLKDRQSISRLQSKLPAFMEKEMQGQGATIHFYLEPFLRIHLHSPYAAFVPNNSAAYVYTLAAVALLILIIACFTYINLSTARSMERAREVGVRKAIGAARLQLIGQFLGESVSLSLLAFLCSLGLTIVLLPYFNQLTDRQLTWTSLFSAPFLCGSLIASVMIGLAAGFYPALILAGFQASSVFKGGVRGFARGQWLRQALIIFQFAISVFLIAATLVIRSQLHYVQHKQLGYDREQVLVLPFEQDFLPQLDLIKQQFKANPDVLSVSRCVRSPVEGGGGYNMRSAQMPENQQFAVFANPVDEDYIQTTGLKIIAGKNFQKQDIRDAEADDRKKRVYHFILNESAARQLGWSPQQAVGQKMFLDPSRSGIVSGVVRDYHFESLHVPIRPFVLFTEPRANELLIKLGARNLPQTLEDLQRQWKKLLPQRPFQYRFLDEDYNNLYHADMQLGRSMDVFAGIAMVLACLGLFGLSSFAAQQRMKEIGVRKVLGASTRNIIFVLSGGFIKMAVFAMLIAYPVVWWVMESWLNDFSYRITLDANPYLVAGLLLLWLVILTTSIEAVKAALANPIRHLRSE